MQSANECDWLGSVTATPAGESSASRLESAALCAATAAAAAAAASSSRAAAAASRAAAAAAASAPAGAAWVEAWAVDACVEACVGTAEAVEVCTDEVREGGGLPARDDEEGVRSREDGKGRGTMGRG